MIVKAAVDERGRKRRRRAGYDGGSERLKYPCAAIFFLGSMMTDGSAGGGAGVSVSWKGKSEASQIWPGRNEVTSLLCGLISILLEDARFDPFARHY